jgi:chromosome segregation ATPase
METVEPIPSSDNDSFKSARFRALMEEKEKFDEEISAAESKFQETVQVVKDSPLFAKFLSEYEKMYGALGKSKEHIEKLVLQFQDLENQFLYNASQTDSVNSALNSDASVIKSLKAEIKEAENQTMQFTKREDDARNELRQTKVDILNLTNTIKQGVGLSAAQEKNLYELTHSKESMTKDIEVEMDKIVNLRARISEISDKNRLAELTKRNLDTEIFNLKEKNAIKKGEIDSEVRNKDRLENELRELRVLITVKSQEVKNKQDAVNRATDDIAILESHIKNQKLLLEKLNKDQGIFLDLSFRFSRKQNYQA